MRVCTCIHIYVCVCDIVRTKTYLELLFSQLAPYASVANAFHINSPSAASRSNHDWGFLFCRKRLISGVSIDLQRLPSSELNTYCGTDPIMTCTSGVNRKGLVGLGRFCVRPTMVMVDLCGPLHVMNKYTAMQRSIWQSGERRPAKMRLSHCLPMKTLLRSCKRDGICFITSLK